MVNLGEAYRKDEQKTVRATRVDKEKTNGGYRNSGGKVGRLG